MSAKPRKPKVVEVTELTGATELTEAPPCPASDPALGMKTPAVVAWWFEHFPEEAAVKYAGLTLG